jgi:conjugal transfer pilus assembly protein TraF
MLVILLLSWGNSFAYNSYYSDKYRGWFWFEGQERKQEKKQEEQKMTVNLKGQDTKNKIQKASEQLKKMQQDLENKKVVLIMEPTFENAYAYLEAQNKMFERGDEVTKAWQLALLQYPHLNNLLKDPVNQHAIKIQRVEDKKTDERLIKEFASNYGFIYFYKDSCIFCKEFKDVIEKFTKNNDISLARINVDNKENRLVQEFNVQVMPSVYAYSPKDNKAFPVTRGFVSGDELMNNLKFVLSMLKERGDI